MYVPNETNNLLYTSLAIVYNADGSRNIYFLHFNPIFSNNAPFFLIIKKQARTLLLKIKVHR